MPKISPLTKIVSTYIEENFYYIQEQKNSITFKWDIILDKIDSNLFLLDENGYYNKYYIEYIRKKFEKFKRKLIKNGSIDLSKIGEKEKISEEERNKLNKIYFKEYAENNRESIKKNRDRYVKNNLEKNREHKKKYYENNKEKVSKKIKEWKENNKEAVRKSNFELNLKHHYGLTTEQYNLMFESQNGQCLICEKHQTEFKKRLHVDHCHTTGKIRGLLCHNCNTGLGQFKDNPYLLQKAINYLNKN